MNVQSEKQKVTLIGLGKMDTALAGALLAKEFQLTIWNHDRSKAASLEKQGAILADDARHAIATSPVILLCVSNHEASNSILQNGNTIEALWNRTLIQFSVGTPKDVRELNVLVQAEGGEFLSGGIAAWPEQIWTEAAMITVAGATDVLRKQRHVLYFSRSTLSFFQKSYYALLKLTCPYKDPEKLCSVNF